MLFGKFIPRKIKNKQKGFSIELKFISYHGYLIYKEDKKTVTMECERLCGKTYMVVYLGMKDHWEPPYEKENITREDWVRIGDIIKQAYKSRKIAIELELPSPSELVNIKLHIKKVRSDLENKTFLLDNKNLTD
jgi:hypothetical protein